MIVAVSPYHLTTREPPAMASILLATSIITFVPGPGGLGGGAGVTKEAVVGAAARQWSFHEFMESWRWSIPLWQAGVIRAGFEGDDAAEDIRRARREMEAGEGELAPLRPLLGEDPFEDDERRLGFVARDLLRGGPDPGVSIPVAAGIDAFAARHGFRVARGEPVSMAQREERMLARAEFSIAVPVLLQGGAARLIEARGALREVLEPLRAAMESGAEDLRDAAADYSRAFERIRGDLLSPQDDDDDPRIIEGVVTISGVELPAGAVLRSSAVAAARSFSASRARRSALPGLTRGAPVRAIIVKAIGRRV